jgi:hypothetical protein
MIVSAQVQTKLSRNPARFAASPYKNRSFPLLKPAFDANQQREAKIFIRRPFL